MSSNSSRWKLRRLLSDPKALLYNGVLVLAAPVLLAKKWKRSRRARHGYELDMARWSIPGDDFKKRNPDSKHIVFVGIGRSEMLLAERVGQELLKDHPSWQITWAVRDRLSITEMQREWPNQSMTLIPFDFAVPVARWLARLQPDALVFCEKFWFANLAHGAARTGASVALINARAPKDQAAIFNRWILKAFELICLPSEEQNEVWNGLLSPKARQCVTGSNRFDLKTPSVDASSLQSWLDCDIPVLMAGSTWELDENFVLDAFALVRQEVPCALLIAPRRFERGAEIARRAAERGFSASLRSAPKPDAEVFVLDTMGELMAAYQFATGAFIGSTLKGNGHNVAEPVFWGVPVAYGPAPGHFDAEQRQCELAGVGFLVNTPGELAAHWKEILTHAELRAELRLRAHELFKNQGGAAARNAQALKELLLGKSALEDS